MKLNRLLVIKRLEQKRAAFIKADNAEGKAADRKAAKRQKEAERLMQKLLNNFDSLTGDEMYSLGSMLTNRSYDMRDSTRYRRKSGDNAYDTDGNFIYGSHRYVVGNLTREIALLKLSTDESVSVRYKSDLGNFLV